MESVLYSRRAGGRAVGIERERERETIYSNVDKAHDELSPARRW